LFFCCPERICPLRIGPFAAGMRLLRRDPLWQAEPAIACKKRAISWANR